MPPERTDLVLTADIPDGERYVLVFNSLNVEACAHVKLAIKVIQCGKLTDCWNCGDNLAQLQFVQNGGFSSGIKTNLITKSNEVPRYIVNMKPTINIPVQMLERLWMKSHGVNEC